MFLLVTIIGFSISPLLLLGNLLLPQPTDRMIRRAIRVYGWFLIRVIPFMTCFNYCQIRIFRMSHQFFTISSITAVTYFLIVISEFVS